MLCFPIPLVHFYFRGCEFRSNSLVGPLLRIHHSLTYSLTRYLARYLVRYVLCRSGPSILSDPPHLLPEGIASRYVYCYLQMCVCVCCVRAPRPAGLPTRPPSPGSDLPFSLVQSVAGHAFIRKVNTAPRCMANEVAQAVQPKLF